MNAPEKDYQPRPAYRSFEDLEVYQSAREFRKEMYKVARALPDFERFGLASQIRRAATSLTNNLAEGHGRFHFLDQIKFTLISRGSLEELMDDLNICLDENYAGSSKVEGLKAAAWQVLKLINGYLRYLRDRKVGASHEFHETPPTYMDDESDDPMEWLAELLEKHPELTQSPI